MHFLNAHRIRLIMIALVVVLLWQIFRSWPGDDQEKWEFQRVPGAPVLVAVYYEALCPDSKNFINRQLLPVYKRAPSLIDFQLVPYGKATTTVNRDGSLTFECQHGTTECDANKYHACTIEAVQEQSVLLNMVSCMITNNYNPKEALISCAQSNNVDFEAILKCFNSPHAGELLKLHGDATNALRPHVSFIPTVTLDGSQGRQASILKDLFGEACKVAAGHGPMPAPCTNPPDD